MNLATWMDATPVSILYSYPKISHKTHTIYRVLENAQKQKFRTAVPQPDAVKFFTTFLSGVDMLYTSSISFITITIHTTTYTNYSF